MFKSKCTKIPITQKWANALRERVVDIITINVIVRFISQVIGCHKSQRTDIQRIINVKNWKKVRAWEKIRFKQEIRVIRKRDM